MAWDPNLVNLRDVLADLYPSMQEASRVVEDAGLKPAQIPFDSRAITNWHNILREAQKHNKIRAIVMVAQADYPENEYLRLARERSLTATRGPDILDHVGWRGEQPVASLEKIIARQSTILPIHFLEVGLIRAHAVARIIRADGASGSGFLTEGNLLITNHHVLSNSQEAVGATAQFNYQRSASGLEAPVEELGLEPDKVFATSANDDWSIVSVKGNANKKWGSIALAYAHVKLNDRVIIIQHPGGGPKQIALYHNLVAYADEKIVQYLTDTMPGSSGSPVFDSDWNLVALHHSGGWLREPGSKQAYYRNEGVHINAVINGLTSAGLYPLQSRL